MEVAEEKTIAVACDRVAAAGFAFVDGRDDGYDKRP